MLNPAWGQTPPRLSPVILFTAGLHSSHVQRLPKGLYGRISLKRQQLWRYARKIDRMIDEQKTLDQVLMQIGLNIVVRSCG